VAFTDNCDLFLAFHEDGANRVIRHIMRQRPSLFNYASPDVASNPELWCNPKVELTKDVIKYGNPIFTVEPPFPILGADSPAVFIGFCAQATKLSIDFHPENKIGLPPELNPPLKDQRFSLGLRVCAGFVCPADREIQQIPVGGSNGQQPDPATHREQPPPVLLHGKPLCFCLDVFVVGHFEHSPGDFLLGKIDGVEIVDIKPDGLESSLECYIRTTLTVVLREKLTISYEALGLSFPLFDLATITLFPTPNPPVPHNPAIEEDQLKIFITMKV
jgi:hypothetical protein